MLLSRISVDIFLLGQVGLALLVLLVAIYTVALQEFDEPALRALLADAECLEFTATGSTWRYRYCHMDKVEQYFVGASGDSKKGSAGPSHVLGKWQRSTSSPTRIGDSVVLTYLNGDICDATGVGRVLMARLSCNAACGQKDAKASISGVTEPSVCAYVLDICAPSMCSSISTNKRTADSPSALPIQQRQGTDKGQNKNRMTLEERMNTLERIKAIFYHAYEAYLRHAFPFDELRPLSCVGTNTDLTPGGMLTLIDALDTLATLGNVTEFQRVVKLLSAKEKNFFHHNTKISVFETTIRVLGGLLSAHQLCTDPQLEFGFAEYDGALLRMAKDLGDRLLPAFGTSTTVPYGTVSLTGGVPFGETTEACTAAAGSLSLEFGMLSVLTQDPKYGKAARSALKTIYDLRSGLNLIGRHLDVSSGHWTEAIAGIGSNIDSIYEYYLKQYILFGDDESLEWFSVLYEGAVRHLRIPEQGGRFYQEIDMKSGLVVRRYFSALQAFWPGVQILAGDVEAAIKSLNGFMSVWESTDFLPEDFDLIRWSPVRGGTHSAYLLRPELAESVFYAYQATKDDSWLVAGRDMIETVLTHCLVPKCGFASIQDVTTKQQMDFMPSFFLSEWVKYMYLLFDDDNFLNKGNWIFTTEAHPFRVTNQTQTNSFVSGFRFKSKQDRKTKFSRQNMPLDGIPSLEADEDICADFGGGTEPYYRTTMTMTMQSLKPFEKDGTTGNGDVNVGSTLEKKVSGYLDGVGMFEIVSTSNSFTVHRIDTNDRLVISNLDSFTGMIATNDGMPPVFISLKQDASFHLGSSCKVKLLASDMCGLSPFLYPHADHHALVYKGPCSVGDGFGTPRWFEYAFSSKRTAMTYDLPVFSIPAAPKFCDAELRHHTENTNQTKRGTFFVHAQRGECSFEEKAQNAHMLGAHAIIISLVETRDDPFIMAHSWNGTKETFRPSATAFLVRKAAADFLKKLERRKGANPRARIELSEDARVISEGGQVVISAFAGWQALFGPLDENGVYRLSLKKSV